MAANKAADRRAECCAGLVGLYPAVSGVVVSGQGILAAQRDGVASGALDHLISQRSLKGLSRISIDVLRGPKPHLLDQLFRPRGAVRGLLRVRHLLRRNSAPGHGCYGTFSVLLCFLAT